MENRKTLTVPFIGELEKMSGQDFAGVMDSKASHGCIDSVNWPSSHPFCPETSFGIARSEAYLALRFKVCGPDLRAIEMEDNGRSWEDSCCEFFIESGKGSYFNIETTCIGSILMAEGTERGDRVKLPATEVAGIIRRSSLERRTYELSGGRHEWSLDILIPFGLIGIDPDNLPESRGANFYKCGDKTEHVHYTSWNPINSEKPDFHRPEYFGLLLFK